MSILDELQQLGRSGPPDQVKARVEAGVAAADPEAMLIQANWRLWGIHGSQDFAECHALLARAGKAGLDDALRLQANLIANGTGCTSDPAAARRMMQDLAARDEDAAEEIRLFDAMPGDDAVGRLPADILSVDPEIRFVRGLLSLRECEYLMARAGPALQASMIVDPLTRRQAPNPVRTSFDMNFGPSREGLAVRAINRRIAIVTGTPVEAGEPLQVLRYTPGQQYHPHMDAIRGAANQRQLTALVYLNAGYAGGETEFPELGIAAKGDPGDCLIFRNADDRGQPDPRMRHAGRAITDGVKWLASRWIRARPFNPWKGQ